MTNWSKCKVPVLTNKIYDKNMDKNISKKSKYNETTMINKFKI